MFSPPWGVWQELILSGMGNSFLASGVNCLTTITRTKVMRRESCWMRYTDVEGRGGVCTFNMEFVCLQGLGVGLQLQLANNIIWNRTLFYCEYGIVCLALKFEASIASIVS